MQKALVLSNEKAFALARGVARELGAEVSVVEQRLFPDGELYVRIPESVEGRAVVVTWSIKSDVNNDTLALMLTLDTLRDLGARRVVAVVPYMPYARQDSRFKEGEALSIATLAKLIRSVHGDYVVSVDMHLHRIGDPRAVFGEKFLNLSGVDAIAEHLTNALGPELKDAVVVGPDEESEQWASRLAGRLGLQWTVLEKERLSAEEVEVKARGGFPERADKAIIVDDIISTGGTIEAAVGALRKAGFKDIYVYCVHPVLSSAGLYKLVSLGLKDFACTNTLPSPISLIDVSRIVADGVRSLI